MKQITIGRGNENDIILNDSKVTRRHHCLFFEKDGQYSITDNNSSNGVYVDGTRITENTIIVPESEVTIGSNTYKGAELIEWISSKSDDSFPKKCMAIETKYCAMEKRYQNNMQMLRNVLHIESYPYTRVFDSFDDEIEYNIKEYEEKIDEAISMLKLISKASRGDVVSFHEDMDILASLAHKAPEHQKDDCQDARMRVFDKVARIQKNLCNQVNEVVNEFTAHYHSIFSAYYETAMAQDEKWQKVKNDQIISVPYILYGFQEMEYPVFEESCLIRRMQFIPLLKRNNLIIRYNTEKTDIAHDITNGILGRLLSSSRSGNMQLHMIDVKDLGGTSNMFKMLDKHVYTICARQSDILAELTQIDRYVEDVVQNLLYGPYTSLEQYNKGKEKQEPYHIVVFKEFPFGISQEAAHTIQRILVNGNKAGVYFIFMFNEDYLRRGEDYCKISTILRMDTPQELFAQMINLVEESTNNAISQKYAVLPNRHLHDVVQYVNAGFEMKKDEILRLTDYMIPKEEWWTKHSANRADIPFGMSPNKQIQKLNITQESGQNSAVVIGIPGSGKSVFLHVLIANAMVTYSPRELQMYLLDFSGVEFDVYARHNLPHARVIAPEAEREFGLSILREVFEEGNRRMTLCRENGVTNIVELKQKNPDLIVPRLLVIIDEFQKIFEIENDKISQEANSKIHAIIQEYRKFGINLILATQKLPAKSIVPYDLIANRVVFKSDPNDFNNLIKCSHSTPQPRLLTGNCVYNNESGAEMSNYLTRSFFINASGELVNLIDEVSTFAKTHPDMTDRHELRTFRSEELPEFSNRILLERHTHMADVPQEVGIYVGESIAISSSDVYVPLVKESNNNIVIIGGRQDVAKRIAYYTILSQSVAHMDGTATFAICNFMRGDDALQELYNSEEIEAVKLTSKWFEAKTTEDVTTLLTNLKELLDYRKNVADEAELAHVYLHITTFQLGRMFDLGGTYGDRQSECGRLLEALLKDGPSLGIFTILQVDNLSNLSRIGRGALNYFNHRIALQMTENDSNKVVGTIAASKLKVNGRPNSEYRALYVNSINNEITKFKPYK